MSSTAKQRYAAYIGSYTFHGKSKGITIMDVDLENGRLTKRDEVTVDNSSYITVSHDNRFLYTVVDEGIAAFRIEGDGSLTSLGIGSIKGMRGCFLAVDKANKYIVTAGHHDGKMTVNRLNPDGTVGAITAEVFDQGIGGLSVANFRPHVSCVRFTPDERYLCMVDSGIDQVKIYEFDHSDGSIRLEDILHCELYSAPRQILFDPSGKHMYVLSEQKHYIAVYNFDDSGHDPEFAFKQLVSTASKKCSRLTAASTFHFNHDGSRLIAANAGDNSVSLFDVEKESGMLYLKRTLPISGDFPKDVRLFPDERHMVCVNQDSNALTIFTMDYEKSLFIMNGREIRLDKGNCCVFVPLAEA